MTEQEYQKALAYLNRVALEPNEAYDESDYLNAVSEALEADVLDRYCKKQPLKHDDCRDKLKETLSAFIERLNPVGNGDPKYAALTKTVNGKKVNKEDYDFPSNMVTETMDELLDPAAIKKQAVEYYKGLLKQGAPIPEDKKSRFYDIPIQEIAYDTGDVFKGIFQVEKSDEELAQLKATDPEAYERESKGKADLSKENVEAALNNYKALTEKAQKTGFFKMLFHLPSYFKLKNNAQKLKEQMVHKGISDKVIDGYMKGEIQGRDAFDQNRLAKGEITEDALKQEREQEKALKNNRFAKALDNTGKDKEKTVDRIEKITQKMNEGLSKAQSKRGGDSKKQADIKRWTEKYKKAAENLAKYNKQKPERDSNYQALLDSIESYRKSIKENSEKQSELDLELGGKYGMNLYQVKAWANYHPDEVNPETGKPFTPDEQQLIEKCLAYIDVRQKVSYDRGDLKTREQIKENADRHRASVEAAHKKDLHDFKHYGERLAGVGAMSQSEEMDDKKIATVAMLNQKLDAVEDVDEDAFEEEEEEINNEAPEEENEDEELDFDKLAADSSLETSTQKSQKPISAPRPEKAIHAPTTE